MRLIQLDRGNMSRQLQEIAGQVEQNKQDLKRLSRFFGVKHRSNIRVLKACGRRKMCELLQADFSADHAKGWDQFLMSLTGSDCKTLEAQGFTQDALKGTATNAYEKLHGCATHEQADLLIADAVANLPEAVRQQYIALFDAVYGKHAFDMLEHEMQDEDSG